MKALRPTSSLPLLALLALFLLSCGGGPPLQRPADAPTTVTHTGTGADVRLSGDVQAVDEVFPGSVARTWSVLHDVYEEIGIPITEQDPGTHVLGNPRFVTRSRLLDKPMSHFLNCGQGATGLHADGSRIEMGIRSAVTPAGPGEVRLTTVVEAVARNMDGTSNNRFACSSYHRLEAEILARVQRRLSAQ